MERGSAIVKSRRKKRLLMEPLFYDRSQAMMATAAEPPHPTAATLAAISTAARATAITLFTFAIRFDFKYQCRMAVRTDDGLLTDGCALLLTEWQSIVLLFLFRSCRRLLRGLCRRLQGGDELLALAVGEFIKKELGDGYSGGLGNLAEGLHRQVAIYGALQGAGLYAHLA